MQCGKFEKQAKDQIRYGAWHFEQRCASKQCGNRKCGNKQCEKSKHGSIHSLTPQTVYDMRCGTSE
ncbi:hypothetical protein Alches_22740 [Alicyclobacillus hesperidum subsp. aegles]|nr:hypothetical protein Alches_22740 [Alicyclobacillus hesperidum subsp. aegles]